MMLLVRIYFILIVQIFCVSCARNRSLTFVIDDTLSMQDDINQVQKAANKILDNLFSEKGGEFKDIVLVTFNDPEVVLREKSSIKRQIVNSLSQILVHNRDNFDCPEYALSGIIKALQESGQESNLYVFTDASAIDHYKLNEVKRLCEEKQSQVVFILTGDCYGYVGEDLGSLSVYYEIARASNGLVFRVKKDEVKDIVEVLQDTNTQPKSIITSKVIPPSTSYKAVEFAVDDKTEYVTIHTSGSNVELSVKDKWNHTMNTEIMFWKTSVKMVKLNAPNTGTYYAWVKGSTNVTIVVYAATDFTFDHGFSEFVPKSLEDASKQPIPDRLHYLSISVTDPAQTVNIKSAEILDMDERIIKTLPLIKSNADFYITDLFKSPSDMFKIQVTGIVKKTEKVIRRISKTAIEPQLPPGPVPRHPMVTISEGSNVYVKYDGDVVLTCKVSGYPTPRIWWTAADGTTVGEKTNAVKLPYDYISYIKLKNVKQPQTYQCRARNEEGVDFTNVFVRNKAPSPSKPIIKNIESVYYGVTGDKVLKIPCEVTGVPYPTITWKNGGKVVTSDAKLSVIKNTIYIRDPTEKDSKNYTCEAENSYGYDTKTFEAEISDFITYDEVLNSNIYLKLGESADMKCLLPHSDPQSIRWYVNGEKTGVIGTFYSLKNAQYSNDGNYTCRLNTDEGSMSVNYVVDVGYKPSFKADAPATIFWQGNKEDTLDCDVHAKPSAKVEWFYNDKPVDVTWPELAITGWGQYSCKASNVHDSVQRTFTVTSNGCLINRTAVNVNHIPLLVNEEQITWPALATTNEFYTINKNKEITLVCATLDQPDNTFRKLSKITKINAKCQKEDTFIVDGNTYKFNDLQCKTNIRPSQLVTNKSCMKNGKMIEVGFKLIKGFLRVYDVCYSEMDHRVLYTKVVMSAVNSGNIVTSAFKHQWTKGSRHSADTRKCAYGARRLVNPEDVAFGPAQTATLSDQYNIAMAYEPCEGSYRWSWSDVEKTIDSTLYSYDTVTVWTGASQHDSSGRPRYLWKVVLFDDDIFETIVYVNVANPGSSDILCPKTSSERLSDVTNANDQYTYICSFDDFLNALKVSTSNFTVDKMQV